MIMQASEYESDLLNLTVMYAALNNYVEDSSVLLSSSPEKCAMTEEEWHIGHQMIGAAIAMRSEIKDKMQKLRK